MKKKVVVYDWEDGGDRIESEGPCLPGINGKRREESVGESERKPTLEALQQVIDKSNQNEKV